ncbi:MAG: SDR family NAD(P)-dependent oxidoreductase [Deltaproteobacteria bacterium]|jgi:short-subunit dehydrogenase|nr:SDR family NAD(P)-dependent oxidoreductase [Deltaproteobacteria bacterium]
MKTAKNFYSNKNIVIIGATGGIGNSFAELLHKQNARLILVGRDKTKLDKTLANANNVIRFECDLTNLKQIESFLSNVESTAGPIDISINLAGYDLMKRYNETDKEDIVSACRLNLEGPAYYIKLLAEKMQKRDCGIIANINCFGNGLIPLPYFSIDSASRAGIATYMRAVKKEFGKTNVRFVQFTPPYCLSEAEKNRASARVWDSLNVKPFSPEYIAEWTLTKIADGRNEFMDFTEKLLLIMGKVCPRMADIFGFNRIERAVVKYM